MIMTPEEICRHYQQAKNQKADITVLADLNATDKASIRAVLIDGGLLPPDPPNKPRGHAAAIAALAAQGLTDKEIASQIGCSYATVNSWRWRQRQKSQALVQPSADVSLPPASETVCAPRPEPQQMVIGDIYARLEAILSAVPAGSSKSVREQAAALLTSIFCEYIDVRLGGEVMPHGQ